MALPKLDHPVFEVYLKSLNRKVKYRPFLVKEEKLLLMAKESEDVQEILKAVKQIITNCCLDKIDVESLPVFDIEMFFVHLRINSVGETAELVYTCENVVEEQPCGHVVEFNLELKNVKYKGDEAHSNIIKLTDKIGVAMKYPSLNLPESMLDDSFVDGGYEVIAEYLDYIYDENQIYKKEDISKEELLAFFDQMNLDQVKLIKSFFVTAPTVVLEQDVKCSKCGHVNNVITEGVLNFFD
jgi:hypothetical protein